jgi:hypothetical protein
MQAIKAGISVIAVMICLTGCAGGQRRVAADMDWDEWAVKYKGMLTDYQRAKQPAEITKVIDDLSLLASRTQDDTAKAMIVQDLCIISASAGDAATVKFYNCASVSSLGALAKED